MKKENRRSVIKGVGTSISLAGIPVVSGKKKEPHKQKKATISEEDLLIEGKKKIKVRYTPNVVIKKVTYKSKDIKKKLGSKRPKIEKEEKFDRESLYLKDAPERGVETARGDFSTKIGTKEDWEKVISSRNNKGGGGFTIQHDHEPEDDICGRAIWNYDKIDELEYGWDGVGINTYYEKSAPINVVLKGMDISHVSRVLEDENWNDLQEVATIDGNTLQESNRYAWDKDRSRFVGPQEEPYNEYCAYGTKGYGPLGRLHIRCYELEPGMVSIQAHEDGWWDIQQFGHDVVSYQSAREKLKEIFTNNWPYLEEKKRVDSGPSGWGNDGADENHDGEAVVLGPTTITPDPVNRNC